MNRTHDVLVIGSGTAGTTLAHPLADAGKRVAVVDSRPFGGTCAMRGCQPKKYLVTAAEISLLSRHLQGKGLSGITAINWPALMRQKRAFTDPVPEDTEKQLQAAGIDTIHGHACFVDPNGVQVVDRTLSADHIVIATGARPSPLPVTGSELIASSDVFLDLDELPRDIVFIGGGFISMEFACVAAAAGANITILEMLDWPLPLFDPDMVGVLIEAMAELGIALELETPVQAVEKIGERFLIKAGDGGAEHFEADLVVHGAGRIPNIEGLDLEKGRVAHTRRGVVVNDYMQSVSNPAVYCIGDAASAPPQLAPVADMEAEVAAQNILHGNHRTADHSGIPSIVFSSPQIAAVGLGEADLEGSTHDYQINAGDASRWPSSRRIGQSHAAYKVILEKAGRRILGAHLVGHNAGEMINIFALAIKSNLSADDLKKVLWAYPTYTSDIKYMLG